MRLLITRHGKTIDNPEGILLPDHEDVLIDEGIQQARQLAVYLTTQRVDRIFSSDLIRCQQTTKEIANELNQEVEYTELLREKSNGDLEGQNPQDIDWEALGGNFATKKAPNGESLSMVRNRGRKILKHIQAEFGAEDQDFTVLLVSHKSFLKVMIGDLIGLSLQDSIFNLDIKHCSLTEINFQDKYHNGFQLHMLNHLNTLDR